MPLRSQVEENVAAYEKYGKHYNETEFWRKLKALRKSATVQIVEKALLLRELLTDSRTPLWMRGAILGVLGHFIFPLDLVPDPLPGVGYVDDLAALVLLLSYLDHLVTDDLRERAKEKMPAALESN